MFKAPENFRHSHLEVPEILGIPELTVTVIEITITII